MKKLNFSELAQELEVISQEETKKIKGGYDGFSVYGENIDVYGYRIPTYDNSDLFNVYGYSSYYQPYYGGGDTYTPPDNWLKSPVGNATISSEFHSHRTCANCSQTHGGTDYAVPVGTAVGTTAAGTVVRAYFSETYGNTVIVNHGPSSQGNGNVYTLYAHGNSLNVQQGQSVNIGDLLLYSGNTGSKTTGPHLHYEVIVTSSSPFQSDFFGNLDIRYGADELGFFLGQ